MQTLEGLKKRIRTASDLLSVVKTMKSLAAVNIRHFEGAARSLEKYSAVVEQAWQVLLLSDNIMLPSPPMRNGVILVIGSDQGMCGQFNETILQEAFSAQTMLEASGMDMEFWSIGERIRSGLEDAGLPPSLTFHIPGTLSGVHTVVADIVDNMDVWQRAKGITSFTAAFNAPLRLQGFIPQQIGILPLDRKWAQQICNKKWPQRCVPQFFVAPEQLLKGLFEQHMFVSLYGALARSLAAENAARLMAMQAAEKNILEMRDTQESAFRELRQRAITDELLDIVSGFEALVTSD